MSLFCCPLCGAPLERTEHTYRCPAGHSFDIAKVLVEIFYFNNMLHCIYLSIIFFLLYIYRTKPQTSFRSSARGLYTVRHKKEQRL